MPAPICDKARRRISARAKRIDRLRPRVALKTFIADLDSSALASYADWEPWTLTSGASTIIGRMIGDLQGPWIIKDGVARHETARVEPGAVVKGPCVLGAQTIVAANAYLRGGVFCDEDVTIGPCCEIKSSFLMKAAKVAHLSFVGDAVVGARVNIEAGAVIANYRNDKVDKSIRIQWMGTIIDCGVDKFGALVGDDARIGANAVLAPGAIINKAQIVPRLALIDQSPAD